jgi:uncharacterized protein YegP (UPF0339 family)
MPTLTLRAAAWRTPRLARHPYVDGTRTICSGKVIMAKFEVYRDNAGEFRFRLKASNGQVIANGEGYKTKAGVLTGIASIKRSAADAAFIDLST